MTRIPLTIEGAKKLQEELDNLKSIERPKVMAAIVEARSHGDLKENAEYHAAREQQSFLEGRIQEVEAILATANIIDVKQLDADGKVVFGSTVKVLDLDDDDEHSYKIVGDEEADLSKGYISFSSPIGDGLLGRSEGDIVEIQVPDGIKNLEILSVEYI